jgi:hypothetical protein
MTGLQEIRDNLLFGEETSDHERSILLVEIMNAIGFSKNEREIHIHDMHLLIERVYSLIALTVINIS